MREVVSGLNWREQAVTLRKAAEAYLAEPTQAGLLPAQPEAAPAGPDWAVLGPRLAEALSGVLADFVDRHENYPSAVKAREVLALITPA